jgi:hypothetical protein
MFEISVEEKPLFSAKEIEGSIQILAFFSACLICICILLSSKEKKKKRIPFL